MQRFTKEKILNVSIYFLTAIQLLFSYAPPPIDDGALKIISAVILFLVPGLTAWRQTISLDIKNEIRKYTWLIVALGFVGGVTDITNLIPVDNQLGQWARFVLTGACTMLNSMSKFLLPSDYYKFKEEVKEMNKINKP
jgi:hypothetical protein